MKKHCNSCGQDKEIEDFAPVVKTYVKNDGTISIYHVRRNKCRSCTWGKSRYIKKYQRNWLMDEIINN